MATRNIQHWYQIVLHGGVHREVIGALVHVHDKLPAKLIHDPDCDAIRVCLVGLDEFVVGGSEFGGGRCVGYLFERDALNHFIHEASPLDVDFSRDGDGGFACSFNVTVEVPDVDGPFDDDLPF